MLRASAAGFTLIPTLGASDQVSGQNLMRRLPQRMCVPVRVQRLRPQQRPPHPRQQNRSRFHPRQCPPHPRTQKRERLRPRSLFSLSPRPRFRLTRCLFPQHARALTRLSSCGCCGPVDYIT
jgi:hypothetical protein